MTAAALSTYSEFGLIVVQSAVDKGLLGPDWLLAAGVAVGLSFVIAAPLNSFAHPLYARLDPWLVRLERDKRVTYNYFTEAGVGLARDSWDALRAAPREPSASAITPP